MGNLSRRGCARCGAQYQRDDKDMTVTAPATSREAARVVAHDRSLIQRVPAAVACTGAILTLMATGSWYGAASVGLCVYSLLWYVNALGSEIAIVPVIAVIATWQWLLGPFLAYHGEVSSFKYFMYVEEESYYSFVLPGLLAFLGVLQWISPRIELDEYLRYLRATVRIKNSTIYLIVGGGIVAGLVSAGPDALKFILYLASQVSFVGLLYMLAYRMEGRWVALLLSFGMLVYDSAQVGLFHNVLLWSALIFSYICHEFRLSRLAKLSIIIAGLVVVMQLQGAKSNYRELITSDPGRAGVMTLVETMVETPLELSYDSGNVRLNQGWIISAVMAHVPSVVPHQQGQTIYEALLESFQFRIIGEKRAVEVSEAFRTYTGLPVASNTSFGISVVGEAWVNFGYFGILFMGCFGAMYGYVMRGVAIMGRRYPTYVLWTPLLFLQAIKMETEFVVVLNHVIKAGIFVFMLYFLAYKLFRLRL